MNWVKTRQLYKSTFLEFTKDKSLMHGAALSYYSMLALVPALYLAITYVGMVVGNDVIINVISSVLYEWVGIQDSSEILGFLNEVDFENSSLFLQIAGVLALMFSCTAIFNSMRRSLNTFYDIDEVEIGAKKLIIRNVVSRLVSMLFIFGATLLFILLYFLETLFMSFGTRFLEDLETLNSVYMAFLHHGLPILTNMIMFSFIFKYMHDGIVSWKAVWKGGMLTSVLLYIGQLLIKFYLTNYFFAANGGIAGTMLVLLVWVYYSSQIIFLGAKFIAVLSRMKGIPIVHRSTV